MIMRGNVDHPLTSLRVVQPEAAGKVASHSKICCLEPAGP